MFLWIKEPFLQVPAELRVVMTPSGWEAEVTQRCGCHYEGLCDCGGISRVNCRRYTSLFPVTVVELGRMWHRPSRERQWSERDWVWRCHKTAEWSELFIRSHLQMMVVFFPLMSVCKHQNTSSYSEVLRLASLLFCRASPGYLHK